jgi:WD40 repeat protein
LSTRSTTVNTTNTRTTLDLGTLPNGNLASASSDFTTKIWNPNTGSLVYTFIGHTSGDLASVMLLIGNLASSSADNIVKRD